LQQHCSDEGNNINNYLIKSILFNQCMYYKG